MFNALLRIQLGNINQFIWEQKREHRMNASRKKKCEFSTISQNIWKKRNHRAKIKTVNKKIHK